MSRKGPSQASSRASTRGVQRPSSAHAFGERQDLIGRQAANSAEYFALLAVGVGGVARGERTERVRPLRWAAIAHAVKPGSYAAPHARECVVLGVERVERLHDARVAQAPQSGKEIASLVGMVHRNFALEVGRDVLGGGLSGIVRPVMNEVDIEPQHARRQAANVLVTAEQELHRIGEARSVGGGVR